MWLISVCVATILGFLAGMGIGGGSLLLLWLTQVVALSQSQARILNLLFFLPAAIITTLFRGKKTILIWQIVVPGVIAGCTFAMLFSLLSRFLDITLMKKLLGGLLILTGLREICYRPRKAR